ncbi:MAG: gliding motility-associated C-terminal domain-containing protein, partial [Owenweeksia sp.]
GTVQEVLPPYELPAGGYVVITRDVTAGEFSSSIPVLGLDISSTALTNSGRELSLFSKEGIQVFTVSYTDAWYADANKDDGGWSLEQIDPDNLCGGAANWAASKDPIGGTPGRENSLAGQNPDTTPPRFDRISILGDSLITLLFSEKTSELLLGDESNYRIEPSLDLLFAEPQGPAYTSVKLYFNEPIDPNVIYELSLVDYPVDCSNNQMLPDTLRFTIPSVPEKGDILVNEILFNPRSGGSDFVEIYNNSQRLFDLKFLRLGHIDPAFGDITDTEIIMEESFLFEPGRYLALTTNRAYLIDNYNARFPENVVNVARLPSMNDDEGSIAVATSGLNVIDFYEYSEDHHLSLIDPEGVSLERQSFEGPSNNPANWQSAASTAGYATPGYTNSQRIRPDFSMTIGVEPKVFSPNQDGYHDVVTLSYNFEVPNNLLTVSIWNASGYKLRDLLYNQNVAQQGFVTWDGTDNSGNRLNSGIYIVVFDYFNTNGTHEVQKETCVLSL